MAARMSLSSSPLLLRPRALAPRRRGTCALVSQGLRPQFVSDWVPVSSVSAAFPCTRKHVFFGLARRGIPRQPRSFSSSPKLPASLASVGASSPLPSRQVPLSPASLASQPSFLSSSRAQDAEREDHLRFLRPSGRFFVSAGAGAPAGQKSRDSEQTQTGETPNLLKKDGDACAGSDGKKDETNASGAERRGAAESEGNSTSAASPKDTGHDPPSPASEAAASAGAASAPPEGSSPSPSSAPSSQSEGEKERSEEKSDSKWGFRHYFFSALGLGLAGGFVYVLAENDFNVAKAEWAVGEKIRARVFKYTRTGPREDAADRSRFNVGLGDDLQKEIAIFFLQLDLDKPNGVRRSDVMDLVEKLGFSPSSGVCKLFLETGQGRTADVKRVSGVSLQEFAELLEGLILEEELEAAVGNSAQSGVAGTEENVGEGRSSGDPAGSSSESNGTPTSSDPSHAEEKRGTETPPAKAMHAGEGSLTRNPRDRVLSYFRDVNRTTTVLSTIPSCYTEPANAVPPASEAKASSAGEAPSARGLVNLAGQASALGDASGGVSGSAGHQQNGHGKGGVETDSQADELQLLQLQRARAEKLVKDLSALKARRGLSDAENTRLEDAVSEVKTVQQEIWRHEAASSRK
ncbi:conserved hypothetical protein [Neospora caninum Liverpool]|uniref:Uncharacterized protein n=1 Tax=Neospora caninum (strain Liverpool) TaxID=572307 RepID=F0V870_NEOCL|nr:conserved hypothetical protein [Neospora caninum Liverpool]CBZ49911.1 conserved hypothetical protein [Neospora caninum Liverpool]CEL64498.1 TPA: hypothetical protein BN1204_003950 [Neospora caninum Liverpool]|eukprot:XP_003879946.1 conserved hypothetical protein [Neospora caninum Liverpool]